MFVALLQMHGNLHDFLVVLLETAVSFLQSCLPLWKKKKEARSNCQDLKSIFYT